MRSALVIILLCIAPLLKAAGTESETEKSIIGYTLTAGIEQTFWGINSQTKTEGNYLNVVDYKTEGLNLYRVSADIKIWDSSLVEFHYENPFNPSDRQKEILLINQSKGTDAEKYAFGIIFDPILMVLIRSW